MANKTFSLKEKVGQFFMPAAFINDSEEEIQHLEQLITEYNVGGLCFFHSRASTATNFERGKKIKYNDGSHKTLIKLIDRYQKISKYPLLISIDAEWGLAMRIENTPQYPYAITLGAIQNDPSLIYQVGKQISSDCKQSGIHWNFSPVVDINNNPNNSVIGYRSFGEDNNQIVKHAKAFIDGSQSEGILTCIKHFPGHGDTSIDSHIELPFIDKSKEELVSNELFPFQELIKKGVDSVMVGHLEVPSLSDNKKIPASISKDIITGLLREEMGFNGVVVSDALNMHSVSKLFPVKGELEWLAHDAGNDILCFAENVKEGIEFIIQKSNYQYIEESFKRVWSLKEKAFKSVINGSKKLIDSDDLNRKLAIASLTLFKGEDFYLSSFLENTFKGIAIGNREDNDFFKVIKKIVQFQILSNLNSSIEQIQTEIKKGDSILLALFPPQVKPADNFGFKQSDLHFIQDLILNNKIILYLFGNPYFLTKIDYQKVDTLVLVYQDFRVFQENAANHFLGKVKCLGKFNGKLS